MSKESSAFVRSRIVNYTNADCSDEEVKNNRYHYHLTFEKSIGVDWLQEQINKCNGELEVNLELWEIHPGGIGDFSLEIREIERRKGIDQNQRGLADF